MGRKRLTKTLQYRDQTGAPQAFHVAHWADFTWQAGPVIVASEGDWGCCKVWAADEAEGKRVIRHAAAAGGWDPDDTSRGRWIVTGSSDPRYGRTGTMAVRAKDGYLMISKRDGPSGAPVGHSIGAVR
jgi:hypothetical protein